MDIKEQIKIMQAFAEGEMIQSLNSKGWVDAPRPLWNWGMVEYRIKPKNQLPKSWEEYEKRHIINNGTPLVLNFPDDKQELMNAFEALYKLIQLRDCYNQGWQPNWEDNILKYAITVGCGVPLPIDICSQGYVLVFQTAELRTAFFNNFRNLIEVAKPLL